MEQPEEEIKSVIFNENTINITYMNDIEEIITRNTEGYKKLYDAWLKEQPMFISDKYKMQMRSLNFILKKNNETAIQELNSFLSENNREEALNFIKYMRTRDLTFEKQKWNKQ